ncbi:acetate uptake transporter [Kitasatospora sp. GP82]|uniref:acetate uptake transporter n=1 Tax=Kitasatospora sp. GP82 TaxID=3035089 RepID=UPI0024730312|nr:acetate uptake transporter [Kitasatospora sp. GP82]MDH6127684.1 succinate-acetate transporter protein [Kitasatospora sp. GP82]
MSNEATGANAQPTGADAAPLGYLALGLTLLAYGLLATGILSGTGVKDAVALAHVVGGVTLFIAGLWQLRGGDTFTGTAFTGLGAFWATWSVAAGASKHAAGLFLLLWTLLALSLAVAGWTSGLFNRVVYGLLTVALLLTAIATLGGNGGLAKVAGWAAALAGVAAWYWATATLTNGGWGRNALPLK